MKTSGFTLVELIIIMVLIGILAVVAIPRLLDTKTFDERGFHDAVKAAVQHARKLAVGSRRYVCVDVTPGTGSAGKVAIGRDIRPPEDVDSVSCTAVSLPAPSSAPGCAANEVCAPAGVTLGVTPVGASLIFDPLGRSVADKSTLASAVTLTVSNQADIVIQPETGLVR